MLQHAHFIVWLLIGSLGVRLIFTGARARSLAEPMVGCSVITIAMSGGAVRVSLAEHSVLAGQIALIAISVSSVTLAAFTYLVFRRGERWAQLYACMATCAIALGALNQWGLIRAYNAELSPLYLLARTLTVGWAVLESLRYRRLYMKRLALGLADPVVANRFLLFAVWTGAMALLPLALLVTHTLDGILHTQLWRAVLTWPTALIALAGYTAMALAFAPPKAYLTWLTGKDVP